MIFRLVVAPQKIHSALFVGLFITLFLCFNATTAQEIDFETQVKPIFEKHCLDCHGPDEQESRFRLDSMAESLRGGNTGENTIVPGNSDSSYLIELITEKDASKRMPPDEDPLSNAEIEFIKKWINQKSNWDSAKEILSSEKLSHWSFQPVVRPATGSVSKHSDKTVRNSPIDELIRKRLESADLMPAKRASRQTLIRRLYLIMHGLPPTPQQVNAFVNDQREDAWELLVNKVLDGPRYGERWASHWLDLARFGESHGFETNRERPNAWPYRDWVIDAFNQDKPYDQFVKQQIAGDVLGEPIATGFLVAGPYDIVKSQDKNLTLMQRQDELADIVNTTGTAFLGLTIGCSRCHNHKFDPISQTDYYAMQAVFAGVNHAESTIPLSKSAQEKIKNLDGQISELRKLLSKFLPEKGDHSRFRPPVNFGENIENIEPTKAKFLRMTLQETTAAEPCIDELEVFAGGDNIALASAGAKATSSGDFVHPLHKLSQINDGKYGNSKSWISKATSGGWVQIEFAEAKTIEKIVWGRDRTGKLKDRLAIEYQIDLSNDGKKWNTVASSKDRLPFSKKAKPKFVYDFSKASAAESKNGKQKLKQLEELIQTRNQLSMSTKVYSGTFSQPGPTHRLYRGEPTSPREQVYPAGIASLTSVRLETNSPERDRRVAIANWIASDQNPLTARVIVNRIWQFQFGVGLVDTPSDFGKNGTLPTHPKLLDWLASELMQNGWSLKHIQKQILMSQTWQQDSRPTAQGKRVDASSRLLWRFPPRRLEAESIRDCILAVTGKLNPQMGGPGFSGFEVQLENVRHYFPKQKYSSVDWRRMIYMTKIRQERDSVFGVFDCPDGSQVTPKRSRSTTPLQALNLFNSNFVLEQSKFLVARLDHEVTNSNDGTREKVDRAFWLLFGRQATAGEIDSSEKFIKQTSWTQFARALLNSNEFVFIP